MRPTRDRLTKALTPASLLTSAIEAKEFAQELPRRVNKILDMVAKNELTVQVDAVEEKTLIDGFQKVANRIATALILAALIGKDHRDYKIRQHRWAKRLLKNKVEVLIKESRKECAGLPQAAEVEEALGYFVRNVQRMQYGTFRAEGYFIGSGVVEAGCKTLIGGRCKQSGMFWSEPGAENILALRCIHASRRLEQFWKYRLNEWAARNDALPLAA